MDSWDWLAQEAGIDPGCFHVATGILKVMESLTAVGRRIPSRLLIVSPAPLTAHPRWDDAAGTDGLLAAQHLMKHTLFFFLTHRLLFLQHQYCLCRTSGRAAPKPLWRASHDHIHATPCLFISCHDSIAISCLVVVFTCQVLWDVLRNSWPVHTFHCWDGTFVKSEQRS